MISGQGGLHYTDDYPATDEYRVSVDDYYFRCNSKVAIKYAATGATTLDYGCLEGDLGEPFMDGHLIVEFNWHSREMIIRRTQQSTESRDSGLPSYCIGWVIYDTESLVSMVLRLDKRLKKLEEVNEKL